MEPNDDDFQPSKPKSYRNTRNKLSNKHRLKLQCNDFGSSKERCGVEDLYSPVSDSFKRKTSIFEENTLETTPSGEQDGIESNNGDLKKNDKSFELSKETETIDVSSVPTSEIFKLDYNINQSSLDDSSIKVNSGAVSDGNAVPTIGELVQECRNESVNAIEHESDHTKAGSDDSFDRISDQSEFLRKLNSSKTDNISECIAEVHCYLNQGISISCNDDTRRHVNCPLCWKTFEKKEAQMLHMKTCAARYNVTTRQLLDAVELQERQAAERQALGLPDIPTAHAIKKSSSRKNGGSGSDGNLQLALALSASMQEAEEFEQLQQDDCLLEAGLGHEVVEKQKVMLERFGFTSSHPAVLVPSNPKSRPGNKRKNSNAILLNRTKEERERLVTEKVAIILMGDEDKPSATINTPQSIPPADDLVDTTKNLQKYQNKSHSLWDMGSVSYSEKELQSYYVKELTNFIIPSKVPAGSKLKHLSQIPGRSKTPERGSHLVPPEGDSCSSVTRGTLVKMKTSPKKEAETELEARQSIPGSSTNKSTDTNTLAETLIKDWKSVLNKKAMSDLTIYVENDVEIPAHKLVLYARCRAILEDVVSEMSVEPNKKNTDMLLWVDISHKAAMTFLQFLYCGLTSKILHLDEEDLLNVKRLAKRYRVTELLHHLKGVNNVRARVNKSKDSCPNLSPQELSLYHNVSHRRRWNSHHLTPPSKQCAKSQAVHSPQKKEHSKNRTSLNDLSPKFHESAESRLHSTGSVSPDLFIEDVGESEEVLDCDLDTLSQKSRNSMDCLLSMIGTPSSSQSNTQTTSAAKSLDGKLCPTVNSVNSSPSLESEVYTEHIPLQYSQEKSPEVECVFDGIDFLEHLLADSPTRTSGKNVQRDIKGTAESKRKHSGSDSASDHCNSFTKKLCRDGIEDEAVKTVSDEIELKEDTDKFRKIEVDVIETLDLTQSSNDSEFTEPLGFTLTPPVRNHTRTCVDIGQNLSVSKDETEFAVCRDLFKKSENSTIDKKNKSKHLDNDNATKLERNFTEVEQNVASEEKNRPNKCNIQVHDDWDEFDEMCHASVPYIFSQCLSQLISTESTAQKSLKSRPSNRCRISQNNSERSVSISPSHPKSPVQGSIPNCSSSCSSSPSGKSKKTSKNMRESVSHIQKSPKWKDVLGAALEQLNESVIWRDENAPTLRVSPKETSTNHSYIADHRTPNQKQRNVSFSDKVTPPADYSAMKTPQLKKELRRYGLKPSLTKKQAKTMLRYIYDQMHPYITVSDTEDSTENSEMERSPSFKKPGSDTQVPRSPVKPASISGTSGSPVRRNILRTKVVSRRSPVTRRRDISSQSDTDSNDLLLSQESSSSSATSVTEEVFCEELDVFSQDDIPLTQDAVCSSADLATAVHNFITSDPELHQKVLLYEPIWIEQLHADLKANNFKFKMDQLMDYLDEQCITFRTAQGQRNRQKKKLKQEAKRRNLNKGKKISSNNKSPSSSALNSHSDS